MKSANILSSRTNWTAIIAGVWNVFFQLNKANGWIIIPDGVNETVNSILGSLIVVFMRQGVSKTEPQPTKPEMPGS